MKKLMPKHSLAILALIVTAAAPTLVACGSKDPPPANNANMNGGGQCPPGAPPGYPGCPAAGGQPTAPTYATAQPTAPTPGYPTATAPTAPATAPTTPSMPGDAADLAIKAVAAMRAPGMQPEGQRFNGTVTEGGNTTTTVTLQAGKCYTIIAVANPPLGGVMAFQAELLAPLTQAQVESQAGASPNGAVLGSGAKCVAPFTPLPVPYTVRVTSKRGAGGVAVQLYSKIK
jgi:hypothetical protein